MKSPITIRENIMKTITMSPEQLKSAPQNAPLPPIEVTADHVTISLADAAMVSWTTRRDGKVAKMTIHYAPTNEPDAPAE